MDEGTQTLVPEQEAPAIEAPAVDEPVELGNEPEAAEATDQTEETAPEGSEAAEEAEEEPQADPEHELAEIELNGKKYQIHPDLRDGFLMHADYTRKTQEVAAMRKEAENFKAEAEKIYSTSNEEIEARAALHGVDAQLNQFQNLDWNRLEQEDPLGAQSAWRNFQMLKEQRSQIAQYLDTAQTQRFAKAEQDIANRLQETRRFAEQNIPGWNPEIDAKVVKFAEGIGFARDQLAAAMTPQVYQMLHLAWVGSQVSNLQKAPPKPAPTQVKPTKTVSAKASPAVTRNPEDMSMSEYVAYRKSQGQKLK